MYIRVNKTPNSPRKSIQIVESIRTGCRVKQKIIRYVGVATDDHEEQKLKDLATEIMAKLAVERANESGQQSYFPLTSEDALKGIQRKRGRRKKKNLESILPVSQVLVEDIEERSRIIEGVHEVAGHVFDEMYGGLSKKKRFYESLKDVVLTRLVEPSSKRGAQKKLSEQFGKLYELQNIYRMMDRLYPQIGRIKELTFSKTQRLFPQGIDLVLFDVTTLYFESTDTDELRKFGYSKDHRFNTTQVVLALATNSEGLPIGYELFEGNKAEVKTLIEAIESWKKLFRVGQVCFVGDRAMMSKENVRLLNSLNYHYIIAAKLKSLPKDLQAEVVNETYYRPAPLGQQLGWIGEFKHNNERLIVSYKSARAIKDQKERQELLDKIQKNLGKKGHAQKLITNRGVKKFVKLDESASYTLNQERIDQDALWDGLHGVISNIPDDSPESLITRYAQLWKIEESFRINKHTLKMRPIFHFKPERIHAHIAICYMAFSVLRHLEYQVNLTQKISRDTILDTLFNVQASIHIHKKTKDLYRLPGYFSNDARKIYKAFQIQRSLDAAPYLPQNHQNLGKKI
jgi:transposase